MFCIPLQSTKKTVLLELAPNMKKCAKKRAKYILVRVALRWKLCGESACSICHLYFSTCVCMFIPCFLCVFICRLCILVLPSTQGHWCSGRNRNVTQCFEDVEKDRMRDREVGVNDGSNVIVPSGSCKVQYLKPNFCFVDKWACLS